MDWSSRPLVVGVRAMLFLTSLAVAAVIPVLCLFTPWLPLPEKIKKNTAFIAICCLLYFLLASLLMPAWGGSLGLEVLKSESVGIYDVQVVKSDDAEGLIEWLGETEFSYDERDMAVFDDYVKRGWCFVVAKVRPGEMDKGAKAVYGGLVAPLILKFASSGPVYPLALTGTTGQKTEVLLYVLSDKKMGCAGRIKLRYAGKVNFRKHGRWEAIEPEGLVSEKERELGYLCKFKGVLTAEEMREDLVFAEAKDGDSYREWIVRW